MARFAIGIALLLFAVVLLIGCTSNQSTVSKPVVKVGAVLPVTGSGAIWGTSQEKGIALAQEELAKEGKEPLEVIIEDTASNNEQAVRAAQKLLNIDDVDLLYTSFTGPSVAIAPLAAEKKVLHLYEAATITPATQYPANSIKIGYYNYEQDCGLFADYINGKNYQKIALVLAQAEFSARCKKGILDRLNSAVRADEYPFESSKEDFSTIVAQVKSKEYDAIVVTGYVDDFSKLYQKMTELGANSTILCAGGADCLSQEVVSIAPAGTITFSSKIDAAFSQKFAKKYPNSTWLEQFIAATTYDMMYFADEAFAKCPDNNRDCLREAITNSKHKTAIETDGFQQNVLMLKTQLFGLDANRTVIPLR